MKIHQDRLHAQVQALNLLLQAANWLDNSPLHRHKKSADGVCSRSSATQLELLRLKENRRIIQKVADDTKTIRDSISAANSQAGFTIRNNR
jgi:hypothetical protein